MPCFIQDISSSQTQQFYYIITFKATCFNTIESSSGLLENRSNISTFIVHSGIPKACNRWYSQYTSTRVSDTCTFIFISYSFFIFILVHACTFTQYWEWCVVLFFMFMWFLLCICTGQDRKSWIELFSFSFSSSWW